MTRAGQIRGERPAGSAAIDPGLMIRILIVGYVSLIWRSTPSGHGNGLRPWIRTNRRRTAHEPPNLTLDLEHAHVSGRSVVWPHLDRRQPRLPAAPRLVSASRRCRALASACRAGLSGSGMEARRTAGLPLLWDADSLYVVNMGGGSWVRLKGKPPRLSS